MALPASGQLSINDIYTEASKGGYSGNKSLSGLSNFPHWEGLGAGLDDAPYAISEFYGGHVDPIIEITASQEISSRSYPPVAKKLSSTRSIVFYGRYARVVDVDTFGTGAITLGAEFITHTTAFFTFGRAVATTGASRVLHAYYTSAHTTTNAKRLVLDYLSVALNGDISLISSTVIYSDTIVAGAILYPSVATPYLGLDVVGSSGSNYELILTYPYRLLNSDGSTVDGTEELRANRITTTSLSVTISGHEVMQDTGEYRNIITTPYGTGVAGVVNVFLTGGNGLYNFVITPDAGFTNLSLDAGFMASGPIFDYFPHSIASIGTNSVIAYKDDIESHIGVDDKSDGFYDLTAEEDVSSLYDMVISELDSSHVLLYAGSSGGSANIVKLFKVSTSSVTQLGEDIILNDLGVPGMNEVSSVISAVDLSVNKILVFAKNTSRIDIELHTVAGHVTSL